MTDNSEQLTVDLQLRLEPTTLAYLAGMANGLEISLPELISAVLDDAATHSAGTDFQQLPAAVTIPDACTPLDLVRSVYRAPLDLN